MRSTPIFCQRSAAWKWLVSLLGIAFGIPQAAGNSNDAIASFYDIGHVVEINVAMANWDSLKKAVPRGNVGGDCHFGFQGSRYDWYHTTSVTIDGQVFEDAGIKKRSWCGSLDYKRPSLKIKVGKYVDANKAVAKTHFGVHEFILNNGKQDSAMVRQCFAYQMFRARGFAAPLCNFAHLKVNGKDHGIYVNVQAYNDHFFKANLANPIGNLYEIEKDDFVRAALPNLAYHRENFGGNDDESDIAAVIDAFDRAGDGDLEEVMQKVDGPASLNYLALELVLAHWDGLAGNNNNTYIFFDRDGKMTLLPWGTDQVLSKLSRELYRKNRLARAVNQSYIYRGFLADNVWQIMDSLWQVDQLNASIDGMVKTIRPYYGRKDRTKLDKAVKLLKDMVRTRERDISQILPRN